MKTGYSSVIYNVIVDGLAGNNRTFMECQYWEDKPVDNRELAINYADSMRQLLDKMQMKNKITILEITYDENNIIMEK